MNNLKNQLKTVKSLLFEKSQIQPSSIDLSLSEECYEIKTSFLSPDNKVREKLKKIYSKKISLKTPKILKKNKPDLIIVLAWHLFKEIKKKWKSKGLPKKTKYVLMLPKFKIYK